MVYARLNKALGATSQDMSEGMMSRFNTFNNSQSDMRPSSIPAQKAVFSPPVLQPGLMRYPMVFFSS